MGIPELHLEDLGTSLVFVFTPLREDLGAEPMSGSVVAAEWSTTEFESSWPASSVAQHAWKMVYLLVRAGEDHIRSLASELKAEHFGPSLSTVTRGAIEAISQAVYLT